MAISKIKENSLATGSVTEANVDKDIINAQTDLGTGVASTDTILVYDASSGSLKKISQTNFLNFPTVSSVTPTNALTGDGTGNHTFVITGQGFTGASADLLNDSGSAVSFDTVAVDSATQITAVIAKSSLPGSGEPYDVRVTAASGLKSTLDNQINIDQSPVFSTAAGSLGTINDSARSGFSTTILAADPESGGDVVYTLESGTLPAGTTLASQSSGCVISGNLTAVGSDTTSTFTVRAKDAASNTSDRQFTLTVNAPVQQSFTSSGTFSVPSGTTTVDVLVVAGGGSGGTWHGGGGGAGGLIYRPGFTVTPGGTVSVTVGDGGPGQPAPTIGYRGQDSVFGTLTAKGGGGGGRWTQETSPEGSGGSSGGNAAGPGNPGSAAAATQPTQSGDSGNYGFGNAGGLGQTAPGNAGGGGGAGAAGSPGIDSSEGDGGVGKAYTIADGTTSVYYAGGGGGGDHERPGTGDGGQGGGGTAGYQQSGPGNAQPGTANRGGGGGGTGSNGPGSGGKGIVIVSY
tara:strand:- start:1593 stop:3140 length:1548 start_codon:yes stop_codon:yes gene_type:complete